MTEKRYTYLDYSKDKYIGSFFLNGEMLKTNEVVDILMEQDSEIKRLKRVIKEVSELLYYEVDLFSDKATEHDTIAYRELMTMDNKDAYTIATATKKAIKQLKEAIE